MAKSNIQITGATLYLLIKIKCAGLQIIFSRREETCLFGTDPRNKPSYTVYIYIFPLKSHLYTSHLKRNICQNTHNMIYFFAYTLSPFILFSSSPPLHSPPDLKDCLSAPPDLSSFLLPPASRSPRPLSIGTIERKQSGENSGVGLLSWE